MLTPKNDCRKEMEWELFLTPTVLSGSLCSYSLIYKDYLTLQGNNMGVTLHESEQD